MNEAETRLVHIDPALKAAGWGVVEGSRIRPEYPITLLYLRGRAEGVPAADLERAVRRWYAMSVLRGRYSGSPESTFDFDIRQISSRGVLAYVDAVVPNELPDSFWTGMLPQFMDTSSINSPYFLCYHAAQAKLGDKEFLSRDITVTEMVANLVTNCIPATMLDGVVSDFSEFLEVRRKLMALKIKAWFEVL